MPAGTRTTVIGVFNNRTSADDAIDALCKAGFGKDQIGVVTRDEEGKTVIQKKGETEAKKISSGATAGLVAGAGIGGLVGLGVLAGVIPVIGPAIAAGTLGTILSNAAGGAAIAGLSGALIGWGVPEEHAKFYDGELHAGRVIVTVQSADRSKEARSILDDHGAYHHSSAAKASARI
jgi:Heat induced stress protein YflT domain